MVYKQTLKYSFCKKSDTIWHLSITKCEVKKVHIQFWMNSSVISVVNKFKLNEEKQWWYCYSIFFTYLKEEPFRNVEVVCFPHCVFSSLCFKNMPFAHCTLWIQHFDGFRHVASWYFLSHCNFLFHRSNKTRFRCNSFIGGQVQICTWQRKMKR